MEYVIELFWGKIATHRKYINCTLCDIHPRRGVETSEVANLMKSILKEGEVWNEFPEGSRLKDSEQKGHKREWKGNWCRSYIMNNRLPMSPGPSKDLDIIRNPSLQRKLGDYEQFCNYRFMSDQKIDWGWDEWQESLVIQNPYFFA